jgi:hypothetical protein
MIHWSIGTKLTIRHVRYSVAIEGKADKRRAGQNRRTIPLSDISAQIFAVMHNAASPGTVW